MNDVNLVCDDLAINFSNVLDLIIISIDVVYADDGVDADHEVALATQNEITDIIDSPVKH